MSRFVIRTVLAPCAAPLFGCSIGLEAPGATFEQPGNPDAAPPDAAEAGIRDTPASESGTSQCRAGATPPALQSLTATTAEFQGWFGYAGALSDDLLVVTAPFTNAASRPAAVFELERGGAGFGSSAPISGIDDLAGDGRLEASRLPYFGGMGAAFGSHGIALGRDVLVIGTAGADVAAADGGSLTDGGVVHVLRRTAGAWVPSEALPAPTSQACALFGRRVAIGGDLLAVGAPGASLDGASTCDRVTETAAGAVYVYRDDGTGYRHEQTLTGDGARGGDFFGDSIQISDDRIVVGAPFERRGSSVGAAYVFRHTDAWEVEARVENVGAREGSAFGTAVALESDVLVIGAPLDDACGGGAPAGSGGRAYVHRRSGQEWSRVACLHGADPESADLFGWSVALENGRLVVGAPFDSSGDGAAYLFELEGDRFSCVSRLRSPNRRGGFDPFVADEVFGTWVAAYGDSFVVGAPRAPVMSGGGSVLEAGAVYRFALP